MRVEFGFQSTCSELVTHLNIKKKQQVYEAMKTITEVTGWIWGVGLANAAVPIPADRIQGFVRWTKDSSKCFWITVYPKELLELWKDDPNETVKNHLARAEISVAPILYEGPDDRILSPLPRALLRTEVVDASGLSISFGQHCEVDRFPVFHRIRQTFASDLSLVGGDPRDYARWLAYHFLERSEVASAISRFWEGRTCEGEDYQEETRREIALFEKYPPLDKSKPLTKYELEQIDYYFLDEYGKENDS